MIEDRDLLEYVKSIEEEIASLPYESQTSAIEDELELLGGTKKKSQKTKSAEKSPNLLTFTSWTDLRYTEAKTISKTTS